MYINKVFLYGNLTRDPELKSLPSGTSVAEFGLATNRSWKNKEGNKQEDTEFHNIVVFGKQAEVAAQYLKKGRPVFLEGRIRTRSWDAQDGSKRYRTEIVIDAFQFGPSAGRDGGGGFQSSASNQDSQAPAPSQDSGGGGEIEYPSEEVNPDDIPF